VSGTSPSLRINGGVSLANNFTIGTNAGAMIGLVGTGLIMQTGTGVAEITGNITVNNGTTAGGMFYGGSSLANALKLSGQFNIAAGQVVTQRAGYMIFAGGGSAFGATIRQNQDYTYLGANDGLPSNAVFEFANSAAGYFDLNGYNQTLMGLTKGAAYTTQVQNSGATQSTLTINLNASDITAGYTAGVFSGNIVGNIGLTKTGTGKFTLSGANTYTGPTNVNAGVLELSTTGATNVGATLITVAPAAALRIIGGGGDITMAGSLAGSGPVFAYGNQFGTAGQRTINLTGTNTAYAGTLTLGSQDATVAASGTTRIITTSPAQLGAANIIVKDRGQIMFNAATTFANNITITGTGFKDADT
ncbi:MAG: hypothetical protein EBU72_14500, partial [Betaproteobacteria bacterium]|nr:hypothetical protein [Betaproteobacteria bacterium]